MTQRLGPHQRILAQAMRDGAGEVSDDRYRDRYVLTAAGERAMEEADERPEC